MTTENSLRESESPVQILLVEDCQEDAEFVAMMLDRAPEMKVRIVHVTSLSEAIKASEKAQYDVFLLDLGLPDSTGTESVLSLKACSPNTPIVVLTGDERNDTAIEAIGSGAQDYLPKQQAVVQVLTRMLQHSIMRHHRFIQAESHAMLDALTGLANRRAFEAELGRRLADFERHGHSFCLALLDIDHFKQVNDQWGHECGDQVIQAVAAVLAENSRKTDLVSRYGGEEFSLLLSMTDIQNAHRVVLRCHRAIREQTVGEHQIRVTASVGLTEIQPDDDRHSLISRADESLYAAKRAGRNRCMLHRAQGAVDGSHEIKDAEATMVK